MSREKDSPEAQPGRSLLAFSPAARFRGVVSLNKIGSPQSSGAQEIGDEEAGLQPSFPSYEELGFQNGPEPSRARRRRGGSEPLTARTVLRACR